MKRCLAGLMMLWCFHGSAMAQVTTERSQAVKMLELELLRHPCFERPFYELLAETLDGAPWKDIDAQWQKLQVNNPRFQVLRGMLAERQGEFENALSHYEAAKGDEWGGYHHARFLAFMGRTAEAKKELAKVAQETQQPWLFREAARGLGEIILLQESVEAAEKYYAALWEKRPDLEMRLGIMEPLLALRTELGRGAAWLGSLQPASDRPATQAEIDQGVLWSWGTMISTPPVAAMVPLHPEANDADLFGLPISASMPPWLKSMMATAETGRWQGLLMRELDMHWKPVSALATAQGMVQHGKLDDHMVESVLVSAAEESNACFLEVAQVLRKPLNQKPWLLARAVQTKLPTVASVRERLAQEVFAGVKHPTWWFLNLLMRSEAGEKPEQLRQDATALWHAVQPEERLMVRTSLPPEPDGMGWRPTLEHMGHVYRDRTGCSEPGLAVVWNLRGDEFLKAMRARFALDLQLVYSGGLVCPPLRVRRDKQSGTLDLNALGPITTGAMLRLVLTQMPERLGLEAPGASSINAGATATERLTDVLIRSSLHEICTAVLNEKELDKVSTKWLLTSQTTLLHRRGEENLVPRRMDEATLTKALNRLNDALQTQRPQWIVTALNGRQPLTHLPQLDASQRNELLVSHGKTGRDEPEMQAVYLDQWRRLIPTVTDLESLKIEMQNARQSLEAAVLPHALWKLQWQPSLRRQKALLGQDFPKFGKAPKRYVTDILPKLLISQPDSIPNSTVDPIFDRVLPKLARCFGEALLHPAPGRVEELQRHADKHPLVGDLLKLWDIMPGEVYLSMRGAAGQQGSITVRQHAAMLKVLEESTATDARLTLAVMHHQIGDPEVAKKIVAQFHGRDGPLRMLALELEKPEPRRAPAPDPAKQKELLVQRARSLITGAPAKETTAALLRRLASNKGERQMLYDWLREEVTAEPSFARHISIMAEVARELGVSGQELAAAEELDLQINKENPAAWLNRALALAKTDTNEQALDLFLEAVRRTNFAATLDYDFDLRPPGKSWVQRTIDAGLADELAAALTAALQQTETGASKEEAADIIQAIIKSPHTAMRAARLKRLLETTLKQQRHLLLMSFSALAEATESQEKQGRKDMAVFLARMALQGVRTEEFLRDQKEEESVDDNYPTAVVWGGQEQGDVGPGGVINVLLRLALEGADGAAFSQQLTRDAARMPKQEHLISFALAACAQRKPIDAETFKLADKLDARGRMRVAWRLCEHAPPANVPAAIVAPALAEGLRSYFTDKEQREVGYQHHLCQKVIPWLDRDGAREELRNLMPALVDSMTPLWPEIWSHAAMLVARHGTPELNMLLADKWNAGCVKALKDGSVPHDWVNNTLDALWQTVQKSGTPVPEKFAAQAYDLWSARIKNAAAEWDPPPATAGHVAAALFSTGMTEKLKAFAADVEGIAKFGGDHGYKDVTDWTRSAIAFLEAHAMQPPTAVAWMEATADAETSGVLHWQLTIDLHQALRSGQASGSGAWQTEKMVPHFANGKHDMEIHAGDSPQALRLVARVRGVTVNGSLKVENLPAAGWVCGVVRNGQTGEVNFGPAAIYCLRKPVLDSRAPNRDGVPRWNDGWVERYGRPVSRVVAVEEGVELLRSDAGPPDGARDGSLARIELVALNEKEEPVGIWIPGYGDEMVVAADGTTHSRLRPAEWRAMDGQMMQVRGMGDGRGITPRHMVLTSRGEEHARLASTRLQPFATHPPAKEFALPDAQTKALAALPFRVSNWHLSERFPRAVFAGPGRVVAYDTSKVPWRELLSFPGKIGPRDQVFMLSPDVVCLCQTEPGGGRVWKLRCEGENPKSLQECPSEVIPFEPAHVEMSPDEARLVFVSGRRGKETKVAVMGSDLQLKRLTFSSLPVERFALPFIAWWSKDGGITIEDDGVWYHVSQKADGLKFAKMEKGSVKTAGAPPDTLPGQTLLKPLWVLKQQMLGRVDPKSGALAEGYRLPQKCIGLPMWWNVPEKGVVLQTANLELLLATPPETVRK